MGVKRKGMFRKMLTVIMLVSAMLNIFGTLSVESCAAENSGIRIYSFVNKSGKENFRLGKDEYTELVENAEFALYKIEKDSVDKDVINQIDRFDIDKLDSIFGKRTVSGKTDYSGCVEINNISGGTYYLVGIEEKNGKTVRRKSAVPAFIEVTENRKSSVYVKSHGEMCSPGIQLRDSIGNIDEDGANKREKISASRDEDEKNEESSGSEKVAPVFSSEENGGSGEYAGNGGTIIKTGDTKIFYILGMGIIFMSYGLKMYKSEDCIVE